MTQKNIDLQLLSENQRQAAIKEIINYFATERDEEIGIIAAEDLLDMFLDTSGKQIYNNAIDVSSSFLQKEIEQFGVNMELQLKK